MILNDPCPLLTFPLPFQSPFHLSSLTILNLSAYFLHSAFCPTLWRIFSEDVYSVCSFSINLSSSLTRTSFQLTPHLHLKCCSRDYPRGSVVQNLSSNKGDVGLSFGWGTKIPHATGQLSPCAMTGESIHTATKTQHSQNKWGAAQLLLPNRRLAQILRPSWKLLLLLLIRLYVDHSYNPFPRVTFCKFIPLVVCMHLLTVPC